MEYKENMCCFCLSETSLSTTLCSSSNIGLNYYNKITSTLPDVAKGLNQFENSNFNVCEGCCTRIEDVYQFNTQCVNSLNRLRELLQKGIQKNELKNENSNTMSAFIGIKEEVDDSTDQHFELVEIDDIKVEILSEADENELQDNIEHSQTPNNNQILPKSAIKVENINSTTVHNSEETTEATKEAKPSSANSKLNDNQQKIIIRKLQNPKKSLKKDINLTELIHTQIEKITTKETAHLTENKLIHTIDKPFKCEVCVTGFDCIQDLIRHSITHTKFFKCIICKSSFSQVDLLNAHMQTHKEMSKKTTGNTKGVNLTAHKRIHSSDRPLKCKVCSSTFKSIQYLDQHSKIHNNMFKCSICKCEFGQKALIAHMKTHEETAEEVIAKDSPGVTENGGGSLVGGKIEDNPEQSNLKGGELTPVSKPQICEFCDRFFKRPSDLIEHRRSHTGERPYKCNKCTKAFKRASHLEVHSAIHSGIKPFKCNICDCSFAQKSNLSTHMLKHIDEKERPKFICEVCGQNFAQKNTLKLHSLTHIDKKEYVCEFCGKQFRDQQSLKKHMAIHSENRRTYSCKLCNRTFNHSETLKHHMMRVHTNEKPYQCNVCQKSFICRTNLTKHMLIHSGEKPYACSYCSKAFRFKISLNKHITLHTGERPYACVICNKTYISIGDLNTHKLMHAGKKFHCDICNKEYLSTHGLAKHKRKHHKH